MRFGRNPQRPPPLQAQRRVLLLVAFAGIVVLLALGSELFINRFAGDEERAEVGLPPRPPAPGFDVDIGGPVQPRTGPPLEPEPPLPVGEAQPLPAGFDLRAIPIADGPTIATAGLIALFQQLRGDPAWANEPLPGERRDSAAIWKELDEAPGAHRGEAVYLEGILVSSDRHDEPLDLEALPPGNPSGLDRYFPGWLFDGERLFLVVVWRRPERPFSDGDAVRVRGRFLQLYEYEIARKQRTVTASVPLIVANSFTRLDRPDEAAGAFGPLYLLALIFGGCFLAVLGVVLWILRRGERRFEEQIGDVRARLGSRRAAGGAAAGAGESRP